MKVEFHLAALTRQYYDVTKEVPDNTADSVLDEMAQELKSDADGSDYVEDNEYWEEQVPRWEKVKCHCIVKHANTADERTKLEERIEYCETINDADGIKIMRLQLDNEACPARPTEEKDGT